MIKNKISVVVNTLNEEKNLKRCLESIKWADEIVLVDMESEDKTLEIAREYTNKIYTYKRAGYVEPARKFAIDMCTNEWILVIDADEVVPLSLKKVLIKISQTNEYDAVLVPRLNYFFGNLMLGTGWGSLQDSHYNFFRKERMNICSDIHNAFSIKKGSRIYKILNPKIGIVHFNYVDVEKFIEKMNRYTTIEAKANYQKSKKNNAIIILSILKEFFMRYIIKKGYKDGMNGLMLSFLMMAYKTSTHLKYKIMEKNKSNIPKNIIENNYSILSDKILNEQVEISDVNGEVEK